ncbi:hypothetical protein BTUL_0163g00160 [Botrytis tulipae]|uniref:Uncharacterized protein n=1 Tax=Botrytis tulipae TaxID=87230 RepID=A0A4Z1EBE3_9HELO|nr:hypothetical protein BTUL_0163g00160 [Botrytis tulipae]
MHLKIFATDEEDICNVTSLQDAYDEAIQNRKELEKGLTILKLVQDGNITSLELLLHEGGDVMETTDTGKTALHVAAFNGHLKIVELLLNTNIEHNAKDSDGRSALHDAARGGHSQIFRELIAAGLNLYDKNNNGEDPLCEACRNGHRDLVQEILGMETRPWSRNDSILSPSPLTLYSIYYHNIDYGKADRLLRGIKLAIENGHRAITEAILFQHLDSNREFLEYALKKAASVGDYQLVVSILQQKDRLSLRVCFRALMLAAIHRDSPIMDTLFEEAIRPKIGAGMEELHILLLRVSAGDSEDIRMTPLCRASSRGKLAIVTTLLEAGAHVDLLSSEGTALYMAIRRVNKEIVALLVEAGANVNVSVDHRGTALQEAVKRGHKEIVELLIENGADINALANYDSGTALQEAIKRGNEWIIKQLIQHGADVNAPGTPGRYWYPNPGVAIREAVRSRNQTIVNILLLAGADVKVPANENCGTPLQEAVRNGNECMVKQLIDLGVDVNASAVSSSSYQREINCNPQIAIREASKKGNEKILEMLIRAGAVDPKEG